GLATAEIMAARPTTEAVRVTCTVNDGVADVRLNRPEKLNALDGAMVARILEVGEALRADTSVRAVVVSGEGRGFCAGLDFASFQSMADGPRETKPVGNLLDAETDSIANRAQRTAW